MTRQLLLALAAFALPLPAQGHEYHELTVPGGDGLRYAVGLPESYDPALAYPVLLALPPGAQDEAMVEAGFARYWGAPARKRGWVVVSPVAPDGQAFWRGGERLIPPLLVKIRETFRVAGGRMHLAGASNGGRAAFRVATRHPFEFQTLTVLPGYPPAADDVGRLSRLADLRVRLYVGGDDGQWVERSREAAANLEDLGVDVALEVFPGEGHVPPSLDDGALMAAIGKLHGVGVPEGPAGLLFAALDDFHDAAAKGDEERYFGRFTDDAVFLGTAPEERWTRKEFRAFALPWFQRSSAWIYVPQSRHVFLAGDVAWFEEVLGNASYGECRGTGAMKKEDGQWRIAQYNLTVPVPNELMGGVVRQIRALQDGAATAVTTVVLVRHAEKEAKGDDPPLSEAGGARARILERVLRSVPVHAVYTSEYRRTRATVTPLCAVRKLEPRVVPAADTAGLVQRLRAEHVGETVLIAGHSNTVPPIIEALGVKDDVTIPESDYDDLFIVTLAPEGARLIRLHYGQ